VIIIDAPHFCAAVILENNRVTTAAPILKYMMGWDMGKVMWYAKKKGWKATHYPAKYA
jgi:hypothetical protein